VISLSEPQTKEYDMEILIPTGGLLTFLGLIGLVWCIWQAFSARRAGLKGEAMVERLKKLTVVNMASLLLSAIGLMMVVSGILLS
jgi:hypothetical protein